ncbi:hypothetical protein GCM10023336_22110 [Streptomyces similanensis]|uniref:Uncharacterized protein n=1 Tax=Streptomyces similanensis TaxID=1274988 RepID=A0ABP9K6Q2_9ACTN
MGRRALAVRLHSLRDASPATVRDAASPVRAVTFRASPLAVSCLVLLKGNPLTKRSLACLGVFVSLTAGLITAGPMAQAASGGCTDRTTYYDKAG